jgi:dTDP-glucose 4,6-dehydratase
VPAIALVTGCAGFIGRVLTEQLLSAGHYVIGVDKLTYAARPDLLPNNSRFRFVEQDVYEIEHLHGASVVFHLAAESHVDNSISDGAKFVQTNIGGTYKLLEIIRGLRPHDQPTLIHVSTDEVYGDVPKDWESKENDPLIPSSPYSASKAAADMLVLAWQRTYGLKARIVRPSNCYGPDQYPEKLIPKTIRSCLLGRRMTVHGDGTQTRMWLNVEDCARALGYAWAWGTDGEIYNVPGNIEKSVRAVVQRIQFRYTGLTGTTPLEPQYGCERPGGDRAYRVDGTLIRKLGWVPTGKFAEDLDQIVEREIMAGVRV